MDTENSKQCTHNYIFDPLVIKTAISISFKYHNDIILYLDIQA